MLRPAHRFVRQSATQFGVVAELGRERADTSSRRAQLDDEIVHFRRRQPSFNDVPAGPAFARVEAGDLAATLKAMVDGMKRPFRERPDALIVRIVVAVPEPEKYAVAKRRLDQLLVLR